MKRRARRFAEKAHRGQKRKNRDIPYVTHPIRVAEQLERNGFPEELVCAAYLHDVAEDTAYTVEDIRVEFGDRVASLVEAHTEDKSKSWKERKQHTIHTLKFSDKEIKYLIVADKLDNLLGLEQDLAEQGERIWDNFNAGYEEQKWYNESIAEHMYEGLIDEDVPHYFYEFEETVKRVFR
ncbi:HD domain-containing protein [Virgibacillus xinjiangensis]|uniref:HD domain-containing protein n=1 Tax=Virgibacillus xinjiangensis TaxID=393090 RepID=A0ABV7CYQ2_9BACI